MCRISFISIFVRSPYQPTVALGLENEASTRTFHSTGGWFMANPFNRSDFASSTWTLAAGTIVFVGKSTCDFQCWGCISLKDHNWSSPEFVGYEPLFTQPIVFIENQSAHKGVVDSKLLGVAWMVWERICHSRISIMTIDSAKSFHGSICRKLHAFSNGNIDKVIFYLQVLSSKDRSKVKLKIQQLMNIVPTRLPAWRPAHSDTNSGRTLFNQPK